jgi:beta-glucosidase
MFQSTSPIGKNGEDAMKKLYVSLSLTVIGLLLTAAQAQSPTSPNDTDRANALLMQMTTEEKIGQLNQPFYLKLPIPGVKPDPVPYEVRVRRGEVGSFLFLTDPQEINRLQKIAMTEQRLHIPILFGFDVIHGFDTEFPVPLAMAASWDPSVAEQAQGIAAEEAAHAGLRWSFAPMLDIARDPRWGRISEGAGEDPFLGAAMGGSLPWRSHGTGPGSRLSRNARESAGLHGDPQTLRRLWSRGRRPRL